MLFGCYVQVAREELEKIPEIDICLGTNGKIDIVKYLEEYIANENDKNTENINFKKNKIIENEFKDFYLNAEYSEFGNVTYTEKTRAVIKVQDGCDRFCSYCMIPYARGRARSRRPENVIEEIKKIAELEIKEVVITGIHIASYGKDFENNYRLIDLLEDIDKIDGIKRIRLRFNRTNVNFGRICKSFVKIEKNMSSFSLISSKWFR